MEMRTGNTNAQIIVIPGRYGKKQGMWKEIKKIKTSRLKKKKMKKELCSTSRLNTVPNRMHAEKHTLNFRSSKRKKTLR